MRDDAELIDQARDIMATTFGMETADLSDEVSQQSCERWSSLYHMALVVALEDHFGVSFSMEEMTAMTSLPAIVDVLKRHGALAA